MSQLLFVLSVAINGFIWAQLWFPLVMRIESVLQSRLGRAAIWIAALSPAYGYCGTWYLVLTECRGAERWLGLVLMSLAALGISGLPNNARGRPHLITKHLGTKSSDSALHDH